jgi:hypothetical protein
MKVALCISGHTRTFEDCFPNIKKYILDKYNPDVFISTWTDKGYWSRGSKGFNDSEKADINKVIVLYNPVTIDVEDYSKFEENFKLLSKFFENKLYQEWVRPINIISMWYKIWKCNKIKENYMDENFVYYDLVIRIRFDILFDKELPFINNKILVYHNVGDSDLIGDSFFMGNNKQMNKMCALYENLTKIKCKLYAHFIIKEWLLKNFSEEDIMYFSSEIYIKNTKGGYCVE